MVLVFELPKYPRIDAVKLEGYLAAKSFTPLAPMLR